MKKLIAVLLLVCLLPLCALAENISEHKHAELTAEGIRVCFLLPQDVMFLSGKSPVKDWAGLPEAYVRQRRSDISVGWLNGLIAQKGKAQWDIQWVLLKGEGGDLDELPPEAAQQFYEDTVLYYNFV